MYPAGMQQVSNHPSGLIPFHPENLDQSISRNELTNQTPSSMSAAFLRISAEMTSKGTSSSSVR